MSDATIYDLGYRRYDGDRTGLPGALRTLVTHSMRSALGLGRSARHKVLPFLIIIFAYVPAIVFVGVAALFGNEIGPDNLPNYAEYYGFMIATVYLLAGLVGPQLLCNDRRTGMLGVYLSSPLDRRTYLLGKALATLGLVLLVSLGPPLLLLVSYTMVDLGPGGLFDWLEILFKIVVSSLLIGVLYSLVALGVSSITDRNVVASAVTLALIPGSAMVTDTLVNVGISPHLLLLNVLTLPRDLVFRVHGEPPLWSLVDNPTWSLALAWLAWVSLAAVFIWWRYRKLLVRR
ncbi:MAG: ABC transporter permease [Acidimicrobiales bacterium]